MVCARRKEGLGERDGRDGRRLGVAGRPLPPVDACVWAYEWRCGVLRTQDHMWVGRGSCSCRPGEMRRQQAGGRSGLRRAAARDGMGRTGGGDPKTKGA